MNKAADDVESPHKIRNLVDGLKDIREKKIKACMENKGGFRIKNITAYETNKFRNSISALSRSVDKLNNSH